MISDVLGVVDGGGRGLIRSFMIVPSRRVSFVMLECVRGIGIVWFLMDRIC